MTDQPIIDCPKCGTRVVPTSEGLCPACRVQLPVELVPVIVPPSVDDLRIADEQPPNRAAFESPKTIEPAHPKQSYIDLSLDGNLKWVRRAIVSLCIAIPIMLLIELVFPGAFRGGRIRKAIDQAGKQQQADEKPRQPDVVKKLPSIDRGTIKIDVPKLKIELPSLVPPSAEETTPHGEPKQLDKTP